MEGLDKLASRDIWRYFQIYARFRIRQKGKGVWFSISSGLESRWALKLWLMRLVTF